jgi:hypothetical protein
LVIEAGEIVAIVTTIVKHAERNSQFTIQH